MQMHPGSCTAQSLEALKLPIHILGIRALAENITCNSLKPEESLNFRGLCSPLCFTLTLDIIPQNKNFCNVNLIA